MAINKARMQVKRGNESDFDPSQMLPGEWAVSLDTKYVRMCFAPGICVRMATYDAFEADMEEIRDILLEAQTIQEAVARIQTEINDTAVVVEDYSVLSKSYAVGGTGKRENEDSDNAKYYYEQTKQISQGINGIVPMGTVAFADLPTSNIVNNAMYNVSDAFTSDARFNDGGGIYYGPGNNVIWTAEGKWDVTASSSVTGIKGSAESAYRVGNVNITPSNIGLGNVNNTSDADKPISTATQAAIDALNGSLLNVQSIANVDLNNYTDNAVLLFGTSASSTITNRPADEAFVVHVRKYLGWVQQYAISNNSNSVYMRTAYTDSEGNIIWCDWERLAKKSDLDAINGSLKDFIASRVLFFEEQTLATQYSITNTIYADIPAIEGYKVVDVHMNSNGNVSNILWHKCMLGADGRAEASLINVGSTARTFTPSCKVIYVRDC